MPFDYDKYQEKCNRMTTEQLQKEWENYTRQISAGATGTATSVLFVPITAGISLVGLGLSAPRIHNARKKREIIEAGLQARGTTHHTRTRDVLGPMAVSGTISGLTLGLVPPGGESLAAAAVTHSIEFVATHTALDATSAPIVPVVERKLGEQSRKKMGEEVELQDQNCQHSSPQNTQQQFHIQSSPPKTTNQRPMLYTSQTWPQDSGNMERAGPMAIPFLEDESVLLFQSPPQEHRFEQSAPQPFAASYVAAVPPTVQHPSSLGNASVYPVPALQNGQDPRFCSPASTFSPIMTPSLHTQISQVHSPQTYSPEIASASSASSDILSQENPIPGPGNSSGPSAAEQQILFLQMRILELELEKRQVGVQTSGAGPCQGQPQHITEGLAGQNQTLVQGDSTAVSLVENQFDSNLIVTPHLLYQSPPQEETPISPPYLTPHSTTLPARLDTPQFSPSINQDTQDSRPPSQPLPAYDQLSFASSSQARPLLPQQQYRQDSGYYSVYSTTSSSSSIPCSTPRSYTATQNVLAPPVSTPQSSTTPQPALSAEVTPQASATGTKISRKPIASHAEPSLHRSAHVKHNHGQGRHASEHSVAISSTSTPTSNSSSPSSPTAPPPPYSPAAAGSTIAATAESPVITTKDVASSNPDAIPTPPSPPTTPSTKSEKYNLDLKSQGQNLMKEMSKGWQWAKVTTVSALPIVTSAEKKVLEQEPDYGPPPAIPAAWN